MKCKLLFVLVFLCSVQVNANRKNFNYDGEYEYRNTDINAARYYNSDFENIEYENKQENSVKFYKTFMLGSGFKGLEGSVEVGGNKVSVEHSIGSPFIGAGLGVAINRGTLLKQIRIAGEFKWLPNEETMNIKQNDKVIQTAKRKDTTSSFILNSYFNFNGIGHGNFLYFSFGIGKWFRLVNENKTTSNESASALQFGFGVSSQLTETIFLDTGVHLLTTAKFKEKFNNIDFNVEAGELGMGISVRSLF